MQPPTAREVIKMLEGDGWTWVSTKGDHQHYVKNGKKITVAGQLNKHLPRGTWSAIKRQANW